MDSLEVKVETMNFSHALNRGIRLSIMALFFLLCTISVTAQKELKITAGPVFPGAGFKEVVKTGWGLGLNLIYPLKNPKWKLGGEVVFARMAGDADATDLFPDATLTMAPVVFKVQYDLLSFGKSSLYLSGGLGASFYSFDYYNSATPAEEKTDLSVSFTLTPQIGFQLPVTKNINLHLGAGVYWLMDGPPKGLTDSDGVTGFSTITGGIGYSFAKSK